MSVDPKYSLIGKDIPYESQFADPTAAKRIHRSSQLIKSNPTGYDPADIRVALKSLVADAAGILKDISSSGGIGHDQSKKVVEDVLVIKELRQLSDDLNSIAEKVTETFSALQKSGNKRWGEDDVVKVWGENVSLAERVKLVKEQADALKIKAENLEKGIYD